MSNHPRAYRFDAFRVDTVRRTLHRGGKRVPLPGKALSVLEHLLRAGGRPVPTQELIDVVWGETGASRENLRVQVSTLRKGLGERSGDPRYVATTDQGYCFVGDAAAEATDFAELGDGHASPHDIAVLPFSIAGGSPSPDHAAMAEHLAGAVTKGLVGFGDRLDVCAVGASHLERVRGMAATEAARALRAHAVLEGELRVRDEVIQVTLNLTNAEGRLIWTQALGAVIGGLDRAVPDIVADLGAVLGVIDADAGTSASLGSRTAYHTGVQHVDPANYTRMREALGWFERAAELDPENAEAHAGIAFACISLWWNGAANAHATMQRAEREALRAVEIDASLPCGHAMVGSIGYMYRWSWEDAERSFRRALDLKPDYAITHWLHGQVMMIRGETEAAQLAISRARSLNPGSRMIHTMVGRMAHLARDYDTAVRVYREVNAHDPTFTWSRFLEGWTRLVRDEPKIAYDLFDGLLEEHPGSAWIDAFRALAASRVGKEALSREIVQRVRTAATAGDAQPVCMAIAARAAGDLDESLRWLGRCVDEPFPSMCMLGVDPIWDELRAEPAFDAVLDQVGVPHRAPARRDSA